MISVVLLTAVDLFVPIFSAMVLLRVILGYFMQPSSKVMEALIDVTEPLLAPIRKVVPATPGVDFTPLVAVLLLQGFQYLVHSLAA